MPPPPPPPLSPPPKRRQTRRRYKIRTGKFFPRRRCDIVQSRAVKNSLIPRISTHGFWRLEIFLRLALDLESFLANPALSRRPEQSQDVGGGGRTTHPPLFFHPLTEFMGRRRLERKRGERRDVVSVSLLRWPPVASATGRARSVPRSVR